MLDVLSTQVNPLPQPDFSICEPVQTLGKRKLIEGCCSDSPSSPSKVVLRTRQVGNETIQVVSPKSAPCPAREVIEDPGTHRPLCYVPVTRLEDGRARIEFPKNWNPIVGTHVIYQFIDEDGNRYIGKTGNAKQRLMDYQSYFNGESPASKRSLPQAWKDGKELWVSILYVCSSEATATQNETSFIVAKQTLKSRNQGHNGNRGEGDPAIDFGSPLKNGGGGKLPQKLTTPRSNAFLNMTPVVSPYESPKKNAQVTLDGDRLAMVLPEGWAELENVVYRWKITSKTENPEASNEGEEIEPSSPLVQRYIGEGEHLGRRTVTHLKNAANADDDDSPLFPKAILEAVKGGNQVEFAPLGVVSPTGTPSGDRKKRQEWEGFYIHDKQTLVKEGGGYNQKKTGKGEVPTTNLYDPDTRTDKPKTPPKRLVSRKLNFDE